MQWTGDDITYGKDKAFTERPCHQNVWRHEGAAPHVLNVSTVEVNDQLNAPANLVQGKNPRQGPNRSLGGRQR
jgi:hypothetical protein